MALLIIGLLIFLGVHSIRIFADDWRSRTRDRVGTTTWKLAFALVSIIGLVLIVVGYGTARAAPQVLWTAPGWTRHLAALLTLPAFVLVTAAYVPGNSIRARLGHPMVLGVKIWALAHLLANNTLADLLLFGSFLVWAMLDFRAARRRDRATGPVAAAGRTWPTVATVALGALVWVGFALWGHQALIGVRPY